MSEGEQNRRLEAQRSEQATEAFRTATRVVLVTGDGVTEYWADSWHLLVQDDGRTVKLFGRGDGSAGAEDRKKALGRALGMPQNDRMWSNEDGAE